MKADGKVDSTGTYIYVCDGTSPGSPVLSDGHALYTPDLSETRSGVSSFYSFDKQGNLWTVDGTSKNQLNYEDFSGFGDASFSAGVNPAPFKFSGGNGCQTDADTGLVLMGHRYYDPRTGRFISQDPAGAGDNWYAYAGNNPVNHTDPLGLWINSPFPEDPGTPTGQMITDAVNNGALPGETYDVRQGSADGKVLSTFTIPAGNVLNFGAVHILVPPGVSIQNNINQAAKQGAFNPLGAFWFRNQVKNNKNHHLPLTGINASWDYKQLNGAYGNFGNFNFGATAAAMAEQNLWTQDFVLRMAGQAQVAAGTSQPGWGSPTGSPPYGDDPADQAMIKAGWDYYYQHPAPDWP